jgi:DNA-binding NarL/FixJ family response regulator
MPDEIRIVVADDHPLVRKGLLQVIESEPTLKVVGEADNGEAAFDQIELLNPQIAVLDIDMPKLDGFAVMRQIQSKRIRVDVAFLTIHGGEDMFHAAMDLGAKGYILKESALIEIVNGLLAIAAGKYYVSPSLTTYLLNRHRSAKAFVESQPGLNGLAPAERRILLLIANYKSSKEIADELCIHYRTVENRRTAICQKLGLHGTNALLKFALQHKSQL